MKSLREGLAKDYISDSGEIGCLSIREKCINMLHQTQ